MTFHVRLTLTDINPQPSRSVIAIGETILIRGGGKSTLILTSDIDRSSSGISNQFMDDQKEEEKLHHMKIDYGGDKSESSEGYIVNFNDPNELLLKKLILESTKLGDSNYVTMFASEDIKDLIKNFKGLAGDVEQVSSNSSGSGASEEPVEEI